MNASLLASAEHSGVYHLPASQRAGIERIAVELGLKVLPVNLGQQRDSEAVLTALGKALAFPDWYGANFDALNDCLTDPDWQPAKGHVLLIDGLDTLRLAQPENFATLIEVFQAAAEDRRASGQPFWLLLDLAARGVPPLPKA